MTSPPTNPDLDKHLRWVRLQCELAITRRLNAGYGFASPSTPAEIFLRDDTARERLRRDSLQPQDTHEDQEQELRAELVDLERALDGAVLPVLARFDLSREERCIALAAIAYEVDPDTRALCDGIMGGERVGLTAALLCEVFAFSAPRQIIGLLRADAKLVGFSLLEHIGPWRASLAMTVAASSRLLDSVSESALVVRTAWPLHRADQPNDVYLPQATHTDVDRVASLFATQPVGTAAPVVVIQGPDGIGKAAVAHALASRLGMPLLDGSKAPSADVVVREALYCGAMPFVVGTPDEDSGKVILAGVDLASDRYAGPLCIGVRERVLPAIPPERAFHVISLSPADVDARTLAWRHTLQQVETLDDSDAARLAASYVIGPGIIAEVVREAKTAAQAQASELKATDIEKAIQRRLSINLGPYGARIGRSARFEDMVLPEDVLDTLRDMIAMVGQRSRILEEWGYAKHLGISRGVSALFSGEPGTGKTMSASVIASELGLELYRIDLSNVVSKWVGETEKHLAKIFDEAQDANAMLVFDEADSLFGKRTEVKSAQDRFANLEVNYVLQRMETFDGICVLTSNLESSIDPAFLRRLNFRVRFPKPDYDERLSLWEKLIPPDAGLSEDVDFDKLARVYDMSGGHIKNAIVRAAVVAARQDRRLEAKDLFEGANLEYSELGKVMTSLL